MQSGTNDRERAIWLARAQEAARLCSVRSTPRFLGFVGESLAADLTDATRRVPGVRLVRNGGIPEAQRTVLAWVPDDYADEWIEWPFCCLRLSWRSSAGLSHRDVLGSLLSLGITRETIGDILVEEDGAWLFVLETVAFAITDGLAKVGGAGVTVEYSDPDAITFTQEYDEISGTVASLRLDAVVAMTLHLAREKAAALISGGLVRVNGRETEKPAKELSGGDILSIRGYGRFRVETPAGVSRKGRVRLTVSRYR